MAYSGIVYGATEDITITLASLATDANLLAGRASTAKDMTANVSSFGVPAEDAIIAGYITTGTSPTANTRIEVYAYAALSDAPTYPDSITGTDATKTITNTGIKQSPAFALIASLVVASTSNVAYPFWASVRNLFVARPVRVGLFVVHNTGVALNSTAGNHVAKYTPGVRKVA